MLIKPIVSLSLLVPNIFASCLVGYGRVGDFAGNRYWPDVRIAVVDGVVRLAGHPVQNRHARSPVGETQ